MSGLTAGESFLKTILDLWRGSVASGSVTGTQALSGTATPIADTRRCKAVILASAVTIITGNGVAVSLTNALTLPCNSPSEISVSGSGTLSYIILV